MRITVCDVSKILLSNLHVFPEFYIMLYNSDKKENIVYYTYPIVCSLFICIPF